MTEYRCTMPELYPKGSTGHTDPSARQGYYITAETEEEARQQMLARFPNTTIDVEVWKGKYDR